MSGIHIKPSHKGLLHEAMGIPMHKKIGIGELMKKKSAAKASGNTKLEKQVVFAENAKHWNHAG